MAVYTKIDESDLSLFLSRYSLGELSGYTGIEEGVENSNYLLKIKGKRYILTIYEKRVQPKDLPFFLDLLQYLSLNGIECPVPVLDNAGTILNEISGKPAVVFSFLRGSATGNPNPKQCHSLGKALAKMHLAGQGFEKERRNDLSVRNWQSLLERIDDRANDLKPGLLHELNIEIEELVPKWPFDLPTGIIHADLFPDNVFFRGDVVSGLIDFYFACSDLFAYDLAICLNAWCFEPDGSFNSTKARFMLSAYRKIRPFSVNEVSALPMLCRGAAVRFLLTRLYDWLNLPNEALVRPKDPLEYFHKLSFHRQVKGSGEYGLE